MGTRLRLLFPYVSVKEYFTDYQEFDGGRVMIENNAMCRITSMRIVKLNMHDDFVFELKQVRHVPNLKRSLISLGMIDQIRCNIKINIKY